MAVVRDLISLKAAIFYLYGGQMDFTALNGMIESLESELRNPGPSHNNLNRLTIMAFKEVVKILSEKNECQIVEPVAENVSTTLPEAPKKKRAAKSK
jgi:hypothetical protein